jgi:acetyltransferase
MKYDPSIAPFFDPQGIVIVGASRAPDKLGYGLAYNLMRSGYEGATHFVNIKGGTLFGKQIYTSVKDVPDPVDLAVVLIPARFIPGLLVELSERGIQAAIIGSGGFRESGPEGAQLEEEMLRVAREHDIRLIGPNCIGLLDTHYPLNTTFLPPPGPTPGEVAFLSQSGAICAAVIDWARGQGYGISRLVSLGNQADLGETDLLVPVAEDKYTKVLALYLEGVKDGRRFVEEARKVVQEKPIIALKVGRFAAGQKAVASHTGALAGKESSFNAAFRRAGVLRADTSEEMFDRARALAWCNLPRGDRVAVLTNAGGPGVTAADALEALGLQMAEFSPETQKALREFLPSAAALHNPVDMLASATPEWFATCLEIILEDPGVDSVIVIYPSPPMHTAGAVARALVPVIHQTQKPVMVTVMGDRLIQEAVEILRAARIPEYRFPERAAAALGALVERADLLRFAEAAPVRIEEVDLEAVEDLLGERESGGQADGFLSNPVAEQMMEAYGIPTAKMTLARTQEEAVEIAREIGCPVVLKVASPDISHKSDVGGVLLNLADEEAVRSGFEAITKQAQQAQEDAQIEGVYVQRMVPSGQEVIVGVVQDPQFGALVMFGSGGTEVEGLKDIAFGLAPLTEIEAEYMLEKTWAGRKLKGFRNLPAADRDAVLDVLLRLAQLGHDFPQLKEIEINPLRVLPDHQGAVAVDVRMAVHE